MASRDNHDDPVAALLDAATGSVQDTNSERAVDLIDAARATSTTAEPEQKPLAPEPEPPVTVYTAPVQGDAKRKTKAELQADVERLIADNARLQERATRAEAGTDTQAIGELGATFALAFSIAGRFMAAKRGPHWMLPKQESAQLGEAWAVCAAPYAKYLKDAIPWALAIGLTWNSLQERLEKDGTLAPDKADDGSSAGSEQA